MAKFEGEGNAPAFHYEDVDISLIKPRKRDYSSKHDVAAKSEEKGINNMSEKQSASSLRDKTDQMRKRLTKSLKFRIVRI